MKRHLFLIFMFVCFISFGSCKKSDNKVEPGDYPVLNASLKETKTSFYDLFEKAELIPLETTDQSLIKYVRKIECYQDRIYVFDDNQCALFIFDRNGKYINKIHRVGEGPGEYLYIYDFCLNQDEDVIEILSPMSVQYRYDLNTNFIKSYKIPVPEGRFHRLERFDKNVYLYWALIGYLEGHNKMDLYLMSIDPPRSIAEFRTRENHYTQLCTSQPFYRYNNQIYVQKPFSNEVYLFTENRLEMAYSWNFGKKTLTIDVETYKYPDFPDINRVRDEFYRMFNDGEIPEAQYCYDWQNQTDQYYYARLWFAHHIGKNMFYNKTTEDYMFFEKTTEGIVFEPLYFTNDYLIFYVEPDKKDMLLPILSDIDKEKCRKIEESDNPVLVKCFFRK